MKNTLMTEAERRLLHAGYGRIRVLGARHRDVMDLRPIGFHGSGLLDLLGYLVSGSWL